MNDAALAFVGVTLVSLGAGLEPDQTVVVEGDRIVHVGPSRSATVPQGARRIDGGGRFLMPGLADMHVHLHFPDELGAYLAHGITTVRNMRGEPRHLAWAEDVRSGRRAGPALHTSGPTLGGSPLVNADFTAVDSPAAAARVVAAQAAAGYGLVKVHSRITREVYEAVAKTAREHRLPVVGHFIPETGIDVQVRERQASLEHVWDMEDFLADDQVLARRIADAGTFVTPLIATRYSRGTPPSGLPELLAAPPHPWHEPEARTRRAISSLAAAGVRLLVGTDASLPAMRPGESLGLEMRALLVAGLPARAVLEAATRNSGAFVRERLASPGRAFGTIEPGSRADLLVLDQDPLEDPLRALAPRMVVANGRVFETSDLARWRRAP